jgi:N-acetylmuramoyl-L-alanine amidase
VNIERYPTQHFIAGRRGHTPRGLVLHTTAGSFASTIKWFADPASRVSSHYLVALDGRIAQFVDERDTARHAGRVNRPTTPLAAGPDPNLFTIGIEFEDGGDPDSVHRPDEQYAAGAQLIEGIAARWGIALDREHVVGHREIYALKRCPGNLDVERLIAEAGGSDGSPQSPRVTPCVRPSQP